jgi:hypothetical protein
MNIEKTGTAKASFLSFMTAPANKAIASCGANPNILHIAAIKSNKPREINTFLFNSIKTSNIPRK